METAFGVLFPFISRMFIFMDGCRRGHNHTERRRANGWLERLSLLCCVLYCQAGHLNIRIYLDKDSHGEELMECVRTQMQQLNIQTEREMQLMLLAGLPHRRGDKAEHLWVCQQMASAEMGKRYICLGTQSWMTTQTLYASPGLWTESLCILSQLCW